MKKIALSLIALAILVTGCAYTEITSFKDSAYADVTYRNLAVYVVTDYMKQMVVAEQSFEEIFRKQGIMLRMSHTIFKPTEEYTEDQRMQAFKDLGVDGIIQVTFKSMDKVTNVYGDKHSVNSTTTAYLNFTVDLIDVASGGKAWTASTKTEGEDLPLDMMTDSLADAVYNDLKFKGLLG